MVARYTEYAHLKIQHTSLSGATQKSEEYQVTKHLKIREDERVKKTNYAQWVGGGGRSHT